MKFLKADGTVEDGTPLTDRQEKAIERFTDYLHDKICDGTYHGVYRKKPCREVANEIIPKLDDSAVGSLLLAIFEPEPDSDPTPVSQAETLTPETTSQPTPENLPASTASTADDYSF